MTTNNNQKLIYNSVKEYPHMFSVLNYKNPIVINLDRQNQKVKSVKSLDELSNIKSLHRSKTMISDIVLCNDFELFATFTFDPQKIDRYNPEFCKMRMSRWLNGQRRRHSSELAYIIVPELHKDGAIHFHALLKNFNGRLKDSTKKTKTNKSIYNFSGYKWGFSTAVKIDDNQAKISSYVQKYLTKDMPRFSGKKRYWTSNNLIRPIKTTNDFRLSLSLNSSSLVYDSDYYEKYLIDKFTVDF